MRHSHVRPCTTQGYMRHSHVRPCTTQEVHEAQPRATLYYTGGTASPTDPPSPPPPPPLPHSGQMTLQQTLCLAGSRASSLRKDAVPGGGSSSGSGSSRSSPSYGRQQQQLQQPQARGAGSRDHDGAAASTSPGGLPITAQPLPQLQSGHLARILMRTGSGSSGSSPQGSAIIASVQGLLSGLSEAHRMAVVQLSIFPGGSGGDAGSGEGDRKSVV